MRRGRTGALMRVVRTSFGAKGKLGNQGKHRRTDISASGALFVGEILTRRRLLGNRDNDRVGAL